MPVASTLRSWLRPTIDAIFSTLPFRYRWRLLLLQPLSLITYSISAFPWLFSRAYKVHWIPTSNGRSVRALVFRPPFQNSFPGLRPLHISIHGGGFIGGLPEQNARFAQRVAQDLGAVVICPAYRYAPVHPFPAAIDDIDAVISYLQEHAEFEFGADPHLLTVSGFSAGGNLALAASQQPSCHVPALTSIKAAVTFYNPVNISLPPWGKPAPPVYPTKDPLWPILPLMDAYAESARAQNMENPRLSPFFARLETLPENMLFVIPAIDILLHEQVTFVERLQAELANSADATERRIESLVVEGQIHGWLELPSAAIDERTRTHAFDVAIDFLRDTYQKHGWNWVM